MQPQLGLNFKEGICLRKTKIICTLGPASGTKEVVKELMLNGMNVVRLNFSHGTYDEHRAKIEIVKSVREELKLPVALLLDTKGPEIRTGKFKNDSVLLKQGQRFTFLMEDIEGDEKSCSVSYKDLYKDVSVGNSILLNDGLVEMIVEQIEGTNVVCTVKNAGVIGNHKGMHIPSGALNMPSITEKDKKDILFAIENGFDFVALSFVRNYNDVKQVRDILDSNGGNEIHLISKIENQEGVDNIDEIITITDGVMVARGDLGVDIQPEEVPQVQKLLIKKCNKAGKPVIIATQMLESMVNNPRPTRAEASDVANAIYDGASAVMLSGETAAGKYPIESVSMMARIAEKTEQDIDYSERLAKKQFDLPANITNAISHATCTTARDLEAAAIITITQSGLTARMVSKFRPGSLIIGITNSEIRCRQLALSWGVYPFLIGTEKSTDRLFSEAINKSIKTGMIKKGDLVVLTAGVPAGISGRTNIMKVEVVGEDNNGII